MRDAGIPIIGQAKPFRVTHRGAPQKVPTLTAVHLDQPLGRNFIGLSSSAIETTKGPALEIMIAGPGGVTVAAIITAGEIGAALEAMTASAGRDA